MAAEELECDFVSSDRRLPCPIREQRQSDDDEREADDELPGIEPASRELDGSYHRTSVSSCTGMSNA